MHPKTMKVVAEDVAGGVMIINEADFDAAVHTPYVEGAAPDSDGLDELTVPALREMAKHLELDATGVKAELIARLRVARDAAK